MAMLAEPRQRKRYNLVPRGKALYEDDSRFGTKMLERMGWKKGQGLGAKEDGSKDFVRIRYKNDALGLGFEERDDQWTQHEQSFNGLLNNLNNGDGGDTNIEKDIAIESENEMQPRVGFGFQGINGSDKPKLKAEKMKEKISGISLEERSKQSKARVHYKKFTKGKDLVQYSEKDLANIFGKKAVEEQDPTNDLFRQLSDTFEKNQEYSSSVQMINNTRVSVNDYFKTKLKSRRNSEDELDIVGNLTSKEIQLEGNTKKKDKKKKGRDIEEKEKEIESKSQIFYSSLSINDYFKKKMDDLRNRKNGLNTQEDIPNNINSSDEVKEEDFSKKKKKNKKDFKDKENDDLQYPMEKKSKKNKHLYDQESSESNTIKTKTQATKNEKKSKKCDVKKNAELPLDEKNTTDVIHNQKESKKCDLGETPELLDESKKVKNKSSKEITNAHSIKKRKCDNSQTEIAESSSVMECSFKMDLTQEPAKNKKKKNKTKEKIEPIQLDDKYIATNSEKEAIASNQTIAESRSLMQPDFEIDSTQEPTEKKKKRNKPKEITEIVELDDNYKDVARNTSKRSLIDPSIAIDLTREPTEKKKKKNKTKETTEVVELDDNYKDVAINSSKQLIAENQMIAESNSLMEPFEIGLKQEQTEKKKKKNKTKQTTETVELDGNDKDADRNSENQTIIEEKKKINKTKKVKEPATETTNNDDNLPIASSNEEISEYSLEKPIRTKRKNVSSTAKNVFITDANFQVLDLDEIRKQFKAFNIYPISSFCAEKFRNININDFKGSILPQIEGYGLCPELQLRIQYNERDEERITNLWKCVLNKYNELYKPKKAYKLYVKECYRARKAKQKFPKLNVKVLKRKNLFQAI